MYQIIYLTILYDSLMGSSTPVRDFAESAGASPEIFEIDVDGHRVQVAGEGGGDLTLLLVHGAGAHRLWWHLVAPTLAADHRVLSIDLGGHGGSDWRPVYGPTSSAREITAALDLATGPVVLVGHSMGGRGSTVAAAADAGNRVKGLVLLDTLFPAPGTRQERPDLERSLATYDDRETALRRFRLVPPQPTPSAAELAVVAEYALCHRDGRWEWKFDPESLWRFEDPVVDAALRRVVCPITYVYGGRSALPTRQTAERVAELVPTAEVVCVEDGHHHLPLDSPREVVDIISAACRRVRASL